MPLSPRIARHQPRRSAVAVLLGLLLMVTTMTACDRDHQPQESLFYVNKARTANGLSSLAWSDGLAAKAQNWANQLAATGRLAHSDLTQGVTGTWVSLGENVGAGADIQPVHDAFMNSPTHRAAILGNYDNLGVGVAEGNGKIWVVQVFSKV